MQHRQHIENSSNFNLHLTIFLNFIKSIFVIFTILAILGLFCIGPIKYYAPTCKTNSSNKLISKFLNNIQKPIAQEGSTILVYSNQEIKWTPLSKIYSLIWHPNTYILELKPGSSVDLSNLKDIYSAGNGLQLNNTTFAINAPTCNGTDKLTWNGTQFLCAADEDTNTTYNAGGTLLQLNNNTFSVKEGTLTNGMLCTYDIAHGLICNTNPANIGTNYWKRNGTTLSPAIDGDDVVLHPTESLTIEDMDAGSILFAGPGGIVSQNNEQLYWNNTNHRLGIGTSSPLAKLHIATDGMIIAEGHFNSGEDLPISGARTAFIWYPKKAALRAGQVDANQWDDANIGNYSIALGHNVTAKAAGSIALGEDTSTDNQAIVAIGHNISASGVSAIAIGVDGMASNTSAIAIGPQSEATQLSSIAIGEQSNAYAQYTVALGHDAQAIEDYSVVIGSGAGGLGTEGIAIGHEADARAGSTLAIGPNSLVGNESDSAIAIGEYASIADNIQAAIAIGSNAGIGQAGTGNGVEAIAIGTEAGADADGAVVIGSQAYSTAENSIVIGYGAMSDSNSGSIVIGHDLYTNAEESTLVGNGLQARTDFTTVLGNYNDPITSSTGWNLNDPLFIIGNGRNDAYRSNALVILKNGNLGIGTNNPHSKFHVKWSDTGCGNQCFSDAAIFENNGNVFIQLMGSTSGEKSINFANPYNGADGAIKYNQSAVPHGFSFWTNGNQFRVAIDQYGNVGIGTNNPTHKLQVGTAGDGTDAIANAWNTFSDVRFKKNIHTIDNALDIVNQLNGVYYDWKRTGKHSLGFIAQDVKPILPEIVTQDAKGFLSIDYSKFTPILTNAIKELSGKVDINTQDIHTVDTTLSSLPSDKLALLENHITITNQVLNFLKKVVFEARVVFNNVVTFTKSVIFNGPAIFTNIITIKNKNVVGYAVIPAGQSKVRIEFTRPYNTVPMVFVTPEESVQFYITNKTKTGFTIKLQKTQTNDVKFEWLVIEAPNARTITPTVTPTPSAQPTPTPGPTASQTPSPTPIATPNPTPTDTPTVTPSPTPSATPTPSPTPTNTPTTTPSLTPTP